MKIWSELAFIWVMKQFIIFLSFVINDAVAMTNRYYSFEDLLFSYVLYISSKNFWRLI